MSYLHLSLAVPCALRDGDGERLGRAQDLVVRLGNDDHPPISGALADVAGRVVFVPASEIDSIGSDGIVLRSVRLSLDHFRRRPEEVLLRKDVLDRQLINVDGARLVRANEIELALVEGAYRVFGIDVSARAFLRRLLPRRLGSRIASRRVLDWKDVEPFTGHVPTLRLRTPHPKLERLHPAQLADLVEDASSLEAEEIIAAVRSDRDREADLFQQLDSHHRRQFAETRSDPELARILARMGADNAAGFIRELPEKRRDAVLESLSTAERQSIEELLGYGAATAGGLMRTDLVRVGVGATVADALEAVRSSGAPSETASWVYLLDAEQRLEAAIPLADLLRMAPQLPLVQTVSFTPPAVATGTGVEELARLMTDFNLALVPVLDEQLHLLGAVSADDVLESVLPRGWRRRVHVFAAD
ncbi:MAG: CBS domain-containing protein [Gaiellaceae bacterium]|jgi:CBS domain-containing protein